MPASLTIGTTGFSLGTIQSSTAAGTGGGNVIINSDFNAGTYGWVTYNPSSLMITGDGVGTANGHRYRNISATATAAGQALGSGTTNSALTTVTPNTRYCIQTLLGGNNIDHQYLQIGWFDSTGSLISLGNGATVSGANYPQAQADFLESPSNAVGVTFYLVAYSKAAGSMVVTVAEPQICAVAPGVTVAPPYSPRPATDPTATINANATQILPGKS